MAGEFGWAWKCRQAETKEIWAFGHEIESFKKSHKGCRSDVKVCYEGS